MHRRPPTFGIGLGCLALAVLLLPVCLWFMVSMNDVRTAFAWWLTALALGGLFLTAAIFIGPVHAKSGGTQCAGCGYDLRATPASRACPECGRTDRRTPVRRGRLILAFILLLAAFATWGICILYSFVLTPAFWSVPEEAPVRVPLPQDRRPLAGSRTVGYHG